MQKPIFICVRFNYFNSITMAGYNNAIYHTEQQKSLKSYSKNAIGVKKASPPPSPQKKRGHFAHLGNEIKLCSQNKCHHHLSNVCENSFRRFHSNWVISDYHSFGLQFEFPWLNLTNCPYYLCLPISLVFVCPFHLCCLPTTLVLFAYFTFIACLLYLCCLPISLERHVYKM